MGNSIVKERIDYLKSELNKHNYNYYVMDNPTISDFEYVGKHLSRVPIAIERA